MISTYNNTITQCPCFCVLKKRDRNYCTQTTTFDLGIPSTGKQVLAFSVRVKP
jgi:hypothetical protein